MEYRPQKIVYTACFVTDPKELLEIFPPLHERVFAHHSTIDYRPSDLSEIEIGKRYKLRVIGYVFDDNSQAVLVDNPKSKKPHPHITISCTYDVNPRHTGEMIERALAHNTINFLEPFEIEVVEGYFNGARDITEA